MTTYTVFDNNNETVKRGLSLHDAAVELLTADGHDYEIRPEADGEGFRLWITQFSRNSTLGGRPLSKSIFFSLEADKRRAEYEIFTQVIGEDWYNFEAMTDADYEEVQSGASE